MDVAIIDGALHGAGKGAACVADMIGGHRAAVMAGLAANAGAEVPVIFATPRAGPLPEIDVAATEVVDGVAVHIECCQELDTKPPSCMAPFTCADPAAIDDVLCCPCSALLCDCTGIAAAEPAAPDVIKPRAAGFFGEALRKPCGGDGEEALANGGCRMQPGDVVLHTG